jgi:tRNA threonylcarbamoyladenosine biosynthesis protein TsaB
LGIETSGKTASAAVVDAAKFITGGFILAQKEIAAGRTHSQILVPMIHECLSEAGLEMENIGGIAVDCGPGSYTGLRIGIATAKGLALPYNTPAAAVSSLAALALDAKGAVIVVKHARGRLCYAAAFENGERVSPDRVISYEELAQTLSEKGYTFIGDGAEELLAACRTKSVGYTADIIPAATPGAVNICLAAKDFAPPEELRASYLEITKAEKEQQGLI